VSSRTRPALLALTLVVGLLAASCGSSGGSDGSGAAQAPAAKRKGSAAEPGTSPVPTVSPAGTVMQLAPEPEGVIYDPKTDILAVAVRSPDRILLLQGRTDRMLRSVDMPGHSRHLELARPGGPILVPAEDSGTFLEVALPDGKVTKTKVGNYPHAAVEARSGRLLVANERGGTLSVVDDSKVVHTFKDPVQPGGLDAIGNDVAMVDVGSFTLSLYDIDHPKLLGRVPAGAGPTHMVSTKDDRLVVNDTRGSAIRVFGANPLKQVAQLDLPGTPYGIAYDDVHDVVWVTLTARNEVVGLDVSKPLPVVIKRYPTVRQPNTVAVAPNSGRVWVASRTTGTLQTIDP
jgi:DNA-binding beta-propeller fold protein YncE